MKQFHDRSREAFAQVFGHRPEEGDYDEEEEEDAPEQDPAPPEEVDEFGLAELVDSLDADEEDLVVVGDAEAADELEGIDVSDTLEARDERIADTDADVSHEEIREYLRETGTAEEIADRLQELGEREVVRTAARGQLLDMRNVTRRLAGDTTMNELYRRPEQEPNDDVAVCVSLDMSGSMARDEKDAKAAVGAFLFGVQEHTAGVVTANAWHDSTREAVVRVITAPGEEFRWPHLDAVWPGGGTPTSAGVDEAGVLLGQLHAEEHLLIVVTDGTPTSTYTEKFGDQYSSGVEETEAVVEDLRDRGYSVVGIGFGGAKEDKMYEMFGPETGYSIGLEELPETLTAAFEAEVTGATTG